MSSIDTQQLRRVRPVPEYAIGSPDSMVASDGSTALSIAESRELEYWLGLAECICRRRMADALLAHVQSTKPLMLENLGRAAAIAIVASYM